MVNYVAKFLDGVAAQKLIAERVFEGQSATLLVGHDGCAGLE